MNDTTIVVTPPCIYCGETSEFTLDRVKYEQWRLGSLIQNVFPELTADQREQLITGTHGPCWDAVFAGVDEE